jgi:putative PIN family toxin of toxin-antitoxin system
MRVVVDTNVLVSALLSPHHAPARVLDMILAGELEPVFDDRILAEYREVLMRPKFSFEERSAEDVLAYFERAGMAVVAPPLNVNLPNLDDLMFLEVAATAEAVLVSGNLRHYPAEQRHGAVVLAPGPFLEHWQEQS